MPSGVLEHDLFAQAFPKVDVRPLRDGGSRFHYCITTGSDFAGAHEAARTFYARTDYLDRDGRSLKTPEFAFDDHFLA